MKRAISQVLALLLLIVTVLAAFVGNETVFLIGLVGFLLVGSLLASMQKRREIPSEQEQRGIRLATKGAAPPRSDSTGRSSFAGTYDKLDFHESDPRHVEGYQEGFDLGYEEGRLLGYLEGHHDDQIPEGAEWRDSDDDPVCR